jgi:hypothetical protein
MAEIDSIDVYRWTASDTDDHEAEPFEHDFYTHSHASRGQIVLAQDRQAPLTACSGNCLLIVLYWKQSRTGMIIHLGRDDRLFDADFITGIFTEYCELKESPHINYLSTEELLKVYRQQITDLEGCSPGYACRRSKQISSFARSPITPMRTCLR